MQYTSVAAAATALLVVILNTACTMRTLEPQAAGDTLRSSLDKLVTDHSTSNSPGFALAVVSKGELIYQSQSGLANIEHGIAITGDTPFDVASLSKQFTAMAIALLIDQGKVSLDDDVRMYLPELPDYGSTIRIRHLLYHTSGIQDWIGLMLVAGWNFEDMITADSVDKLIRSQNKLNFVPGTDYRYSNSGYVLLSQIVAHVTGERFGEWMTTNVFSPLGMVNTQVLDDPHALVLGRAKAYAANQNRSFDAMGHSAAVPGSGSVFSTAKDLGRWMVNFQHPVAGFEAIINMMKIPGTLDDGKPISYGFGNAFSLGDNETHKISHRGKWPAFNAAMHYYPREQLSFAILANSDSVNIGKVSQQIETIFGVPSQANTFKPLLAEPDLRLDPEQIAQLPGIYLRKENQHMAEIVLEDGSLWYLWNATDGRPLQRIGDFTFRMLDFFADTILSFPPGSGRMDVTENGESWTYDRAERAFYSPSETCELSGVYSNLSLSSVFHIKASPDSLLMTHLRLEGMIFRSHPTEDKFVSQEASIPMITFTRKENGLVDGFDIEQGWNRPIHFEKTESASCQ